MAHSIRWTQVKVSKKEFLLSLPVSLILTKHRKYKIAPRIIIKCYKSFLCKASRDQEARVDEKTESEKSRGTVPFILFVRSHHTSPIPECFFRYEAYIGTLRGKPENYLIWSHLDWNHPAQQVLSWSCSISCPSGLSWWQWLGLFLGFSLCCHILPPPPHGHLILKTACTAFFSYKIIIMYSNVP